MPIIELINASIFQNNKSVLENVNIEVAKGDFVFLIGRTGSGKSSLIKILYGDLPLEKGIGNVFGNEIGSLLKVFKDGNHLPSATIEVVYCLFLPLKNNGI